MCQKSQYNYFCVFFFNFVNILYSDRGFMYFAISLHCNTHISSVLFPHKLQISVTELLLLLLLLLLLSSSSSSSSPLCRVFIIIFLRQTCSYSVVSIHGAYIVSFYCTLHLYYYYYIVTLML